MTANIDKAEKVLLKAIDEEHVLNFALEKLAGLQQRIQAAPNVAVNGDGVDAQSLLRNEQESSSSIALIAGVVDASELDRLQRLIFRTTKGKSLIESKAIIEEGDRPTRAAYLIMFWDGAMVKDRIQKICDSFTGDRFNIPDNRNAIGATINEVK